MEILIRPLIQGAFTAWPVILAYLAFVFASESMNPFKRPKSTAKRRGWKIGRRVALGILAVGFLIKVVSHTSILSSAHATDTISPLPAISMDYLA